MTAWFPALRWGIGVALVSRFVLLVWMAFMWLTFGEGYNIPADLHTDPIANLPALNTPLERAVFGVWRRWDASHYLNLAQNGYRPTDIGPTVFGPLTPGSIRLFDIIIPGWLDLAALVYATVAFALALTLLYRLCEVYYGDAHLGRWAVGVLAVLPLAFFFNAPMSEAIYLAFALAVFYAGARERWGLAAIAGALATLARAQGGLLAGVAGLMLVETSWRRYPTWPERIRYMVRAGWVLLLIPLAFWGFLVFRDNLDLPSLTEIYRTRSFIFFVNPVEGLFINLRWLVEHPAAALTNPDMWALVVGLVLCGLFLRNPRQRRLPLIAYTLATLLIAVSKVNWEWGGEERVLYSQSLGRYLLPLFPLVIMVADWLRHSLPRIRLVYITLSASALLILSALFALGGGNP